MNLSIFKNIDISNIKQFLNKKIVIVAVALIIFVELVWAILELTNISLPMLAKKSLSNSVDSAVSQQIKSADETTSIKLATINPQYKVGDRIPVTISLSSLKYTDGTDLIIFYNPKLLTVETDKKKAPVAVGLIYDDYPVNSVDEKNGKIMISGISTKTNGVIAQGTFGTISFLAKADGKTAITIDFTPGSTIDTNVIETKTAKDVLQQAQNLNLEIVK